jgi:ParB/RepB/Spo0J family partition protein
MITKSKKAKAPAVARIVRFERPAPNGSAAAAANPGGTSKHPVDLRLLVSQLEASPTNPRKTFDEDELQQLADSLKQHGLLEPILVREQKDFVKAGGQKVYEIVAGERRYRAAKLARLKDLPCRVADLSDDEVLEIQLVENLARTDLNAIEEAIGFQQILSRGTTQQQLATKIGKTQGHISNRVRLLELPAEWQAKVIDGTLPPTHARAIIPYKHLTAAMKDLAKELKSSRDDLPPSLETWEHWIRSSIRETTFPLSGHVPYDQGGGEWKIKPNDAQRTELGVIDAPGWNGAEPRATNKAAWEKLRTAATEKVLARNKNKTTSGGGKAKKPGASSGMSAAEKKKQFDARLYRWRVDWLRRICDRKLAEMGTKQENGPLMMRLVLYFLTSNDLQLIDDRQRAMAFLLRERSIAIKPRKAGMCFLHRHDIWQALEELDDHALTQLKVDLIRAWLVEPDRDDVEGEPTNHLPPDRVEQLAAKLKVCLSNEWHAWHGDECLREYFDFHTKDQLLALLKEMGDACPGSGASKGQLVEAALTTKCAIPAEILAAKEPKR